MAASPKFPEAALLSLMGLGLKYRSHFTVSVVEITRQSKRTKGDKYERVFKARTDTNPQQPLQDLQLIPAD